MFFTVYQTTNITNNKIYIGTHITNDPNDDYLGSGKWLKNSINKYGANSFTKIVLFTYDNAEEMFTKEAELVNEEFINRPDTYNIHLGGHGGWDYVNDGSLKHLERSRKGGIKTGPLAKLYKIGFGSFSKELRTKISGKAFLGKHHTEETKAKIGKANSLHQQGSNNSMYGRCWVTNGIENKSIPKEKLDNYILLGYRKGRI